jgi:hypothetical protein
VKKYSYLKSFDQASHGGWVNTEQRREEGALSRSYFTGYSWGPVMYHWGPPYPTLSPVGLAYYSSSQGVGPH